MNNKKIIFKFDKRFKQPYIFLSIVLIVINLVCVFFAKDIDIKGIIICTLLFGSITLPCLILILISINKKIIYDNGIFYVQNMFKINKEYNIKDIINAVEYSWDGMKIYLKNNRKFKVDIQMSNYSKIKDIFEENNIDFRDRFGNINPKGW